MTPASLDEAQRALSESRGTVAFAGGRTEVPAPPAADLLIETTKLDRIVEYAPSDQVVTAECGVTLAALQRELAKHGQRLALDPARAALRAPAGRANHWMAGLETAPAIRRGASRKSSAFAVGGVSSTIRS